MTTTTGPGQMAQDSDIVHGLLDSPMMPTRNTLLSISRQLVGGMTQICMPRRDFYANTQVAILKLGKIIKSKIVYYVYLYV